MDGAKCPLVCYTDISVFDWEKFLKYSFVQEWSVHSRCWYRMQVPKSKVRGLCSIWETEIQRNITYWFLTIDEGMILVLYHSFD